MNKKQMVTAINKMAQEMEVDVKGFAANANVKWNSKTSAADVELVFAQISKVYNERSSLAKAIYAMSTEPNMTVEFLMTRTRRALEAQYRDMKMDNFNAQTQAQSPASDESSQAENTTQKENVEMKKETQQEKTYTATEVQAMINQVKEQLTEGLTADFTAKMEAMQNQFTAQQTATTEDKPATEEQIAAPAPTQQKDNVNVGELYDALEKKGDAVLAQANDAIENNKLEEAEKGFTKYEAVRAKMNELMEKHKDLILTPERSKRIFDNARQATADALRTTGDVTDKYGHKGIDGLMSIASEVITGSVQVIETTLKATESIARTGVDVTGKVGHAAVDATAGTFYATADFVEKKESDKE